MSSSTAAASSRRRAVGSTGWIWPDAAIASRSSTIEAFSAWLRMAHAPHSTPMTLRLLSSTWLSGMRGISPAANPSTRYRPPQRIERSAGSALSPPTGSTTMSAPPPVTSRMAVFRSTPGSS
jgi:hypothetical protein